MRTFVVGLAGCLAILAATVSEGAIFTNGSFEAGPNPGSFTLLGAGNSSIAGWTVSGGSIDYIGSYWAASDGSRSIDLNGVAPGAISQTFDTLPGQQYTVLFDIAGNPAGGPTTKALEVSVVGTLDPAGSYTFDTTGHQLWSMGWETNSFTFVATGSSATLTFASTTTANSGNGTYPFAFGPALDNVQVHATPEPATLTMWGVFGVSTLLVGRWRRRAIRM